MCSFNSSWAAYANCIVLLIVLCLWEGAVFFVAKVFALIRGHFGRG